MCIRDRPQARGRVHLQRPQAPAAGEPESERRGDPRLLALPCLLYTSDAADERSSVDLGGRRIIKKKKI